MDKVVTLGSLDGFEMINRVYDGGGYRSNYRRVTWQQLQTSFSARARR